MIWWWVLIFALSGAPGVADPDQAPVPTDPAHSARSAASGHPAPRESYWGPIPARSDSNSVRLENPSTPTWEHVANAPYHLVGIPFRIGNFITRETVETMDGWGLFDMPPVPEKGLPLPGGFLMMPQGGYSSLAGWQLGANFRHPHFLGERNKAYLVVESSTRHADILGGGFRFALGDVWELDLGGGGTDIPLARYFGRGHQAGEDEESYYNRISRWGGFDLTRRMTTHSHTRLRVFFSRLIARESAYNTDEALRFVHDRHLPAGFPGESEGITTQVDWFLDTAQVDGRPTHGTFKRLALAYFQSTDGSDLSYLQYTFDVQRFLPLWHTKRVLGLRAFGTRILPDGGGPVPLTRLVSSYRPYDLRGIESHRYHGLGNLGLSAEYRWPIWVVKGRSETGVDAFLFADTGQVYDHADEISFAHFAFTYGLGLRLLGSRDNLMASVSIGFGPGDTQFNFGFSQAFQYSGKGMMYGSDPTRRP